MQLEITDFRPLSKGTLSGFLNIRFRGQGLEVRDIALHESNGKKWLSMPAKRFTTPNGGNAWANIVCFSDKGKFKTFQEAVLKALGTFLDSAKGDENERESSN